MAKLAVVNRDKRRKTVAKFAVKRAELLAILNNMKLSDEERAEARAKFKRCREIRRPSVFATVVH